MPTFVPLAVERQSSKRAILATVAAVDLRVTPGESEQAALEARGGSMRRLGSIGAPLALFGTIGWAWWTWRREGDDPELVDSPSILMAGPRPAEMTPALATVVREGRASQHTVNTLLVELARQRTDLEFREPGSRLRWMQVR